MLSAINYSPAQIFSTSLGVKTAAGYIAGMMNRFVLLIGMMSLLVLTSCKSLSKLTSRDNSTAKSAPAKTTASQQRTFLDQIEVTPGSVVTTGHKASTTNSSAASTAKSGKKNNTGTTDMNAFNIERAGYLQLKYAVIIDATVEKLTNIPLLETIEKWWGTKYCLGGNTEDCIDCSAFTQVVMRDVFNTTLPRTAQEQFDNSEKIELADLQEGDLVFFHTSGRNRDITHVGVYLLNNKFVHAATSGGVMISDLNEKYWQPRFRGAGRVVK